MKKQSEINIPQEIANRINDIVPVAEILACYVLCAGIGPDRIKLFGSIIKKAIKTGFIYVLRASKWKKTSEGYMFDLDSCVAFKIDANTTFASVDSYLDNTQYDFNVSEHIKRAQEQAFNESDNYIHSFADFMGSSQDDSLKDTIKNLTDPDITGMEALAGKLISNSALGLSSEEQQPYSKFSKREKAAIDLKAPISGTEWLDNMIKKANEYQMDQRLIEREKELKLENSL